MTPNSPLERFLAAQPSIQCLYGIHSRWRTCPTVTSTFLPALRVISCGPEITARLVPSRRLVSVSCTASMQAAENILDAIVESGTRLVYLSLQLDDLALEPMVRRIVKSAPGLKMIDVPDCMMYPECRKILGELALLEELVCDVPYEKWNGWDPAIFSQWISPHGPRLKRVIFFRVSCSPTACRSLGARQLQQQQWRQVAPVHSLCFETHMVGYAAQIPCGD